MATASRTDKLQAAHERLQEAVESIVSGEEWQRMLRTAAKFHRYSMNNILLISLQRPDATLVAGFRRWQELNRVVRKGEKGIAIFAPIKYRVAADASGGGTKDLDLPFRRDRSAAKRERSKTEPKTLQQLRGFRVVHVFDISQTDGDEIPDLDAVRPKLLDGDAPEGIWDALVAQANTAGFDVIRTQKGAENGYCDFMNKEIAVRPDVSGVQAVKTLVHELGHALLHDEGAQPSREIAEVEVESVAFIVCDALGLDSGDYSFAYVAQWSGGDPDKIKETADRVVGCSRRILQGMTPDTTSQMTSNAISSRP